MSRNRVSDLIGVLRGAGTVANAILKQQEDAIKRSVKHSSLTACADGCLRDLRTKWSDVEPSKVPARLVAQLQETVERINVIEKGVTQYAKAKANEALGIQIDYEPRSNGTRLHVYDRSKDPKEVAKEASNRPVESDNEVSSASAKRYSTVKEKIDTISHLDEEIPKIELSDKDKAILRKLELEHERKIQSTTPESTVTVPSKTSEEKSNDASDKSISKPSNRVKSSLSSTAKERKVPATRLQRMVSFGTLGIGLGLGTVAEYTRRSLGMKEQSIGESFDSMFLTKANAERIVSTLCKVRGVALKIGQILSIQDNTVISPELQRAFERVRQSADFMPKWQVEKVLAGELGHDWRRKLDKFEERPFAAASIGQVHYGTLSDSREVAIKIQYPGVAMGIQSDIENLVGIMKVWNMFPEGMFIDNLVEVAKRELAWEVDYVREAECTRKYKRLVEPYSDYYVPEVIDELSTSQVFTTELVDGIPVDKCEDMDLETRQHICKMIMRLCLKELFVFRYMQTDPNWSNFFYNPQTRQLVLLDFGACRSYDKLFMDKYIEVINAACEGDRGRVLTLSREMKFLTGYESKIMEEAHVDTVMTLGQVFDKDRKYYDFGGQDVTKRMQKLVPTIINHRLCPPPEEIYSLHRKLSGVFLLCAKLRVKINCRDMFREVYESYRFG